jgi:hypothetical protein
LEGGIAPVEIGLKKYEKSILPLERGDYEAARLAASRT